MTDKPDNVDLRSHDAAGDKIAELLRLFPEIRTEEGKLDFDRLKLALGETVDVGKERYGMNWPGKADCFKTIQAPSLGTLRPCREESVNFDTTQNLIIEGDNLEVLKLLQKSYLGKVKMIYIDPPYNTGNDFIYPDNYAESLQTYLEFTGQVDEEGRKFGTNTEADGRFHSKWMNMMHPRLYLARNLLRDDGAVFISIDDGEVCNLRKLCDEIFGEENYIECFVWKRSYGGGAREKFAVGQHEYIFLYAKHRDQLEELWLPSNPHVEAKYYKFKDEHFDRRGPYRIQPLEAAKSLTERRNLVFPITLPDGTGEVNPKYRWLWSRERVLNVLAENGLVFTKRIDDHGKHQWAVSYKQYLRGETGEKRGRVALQSFTAPRSAARQSVPMIHPRCHRSLDHCRVWDRVLDSWQGGTALESSEKQWSSSCLAGWRCFGVGRKAVRFVNLVCFSDAISAIRYCSVVTFDVTDRTWVCPLAPVLRGEG